MRNIARVLICFWLVGPPTTLAADKAQAHKAAGSQENVPVSPTNAPAASTKGKRTKPLRSARRAVHEGNLLLRAGDAAGALKDYDDAARLEPDAPEIPFVRGLSYFGLGKYDEAREAFQKAAAAKNPQLAGDALYSLGTTYHARALSHLDKPEEAIKDLEQAMQKYRTVLADHPDHRAARDADFKAASLRRRLVKKLEKQKQQQQQKNQQEKKKKERQKQQKQDSSKDKQKNKDEQNQSAQKDSKSASEKQDEKQSQKQQESKSEQQQKNDKKQSSDQQNQTPNDKEQPSAVAQQKQVKKENERNSRQQARRRLREMMQAQRDRKKHRSPPRGRVTVRPVDKDW